jgi:hypothetical protein
MSNKHAMGFFAGLALVVAGVAVGCGSARARDGYETEPALGIGDGREAAAPCTGLQCKQTTCSGGLQTTVTGTVFAPNGTLPLYNAIVYVPNAKPDPLPQGATCDPCGAVTGSPIVTALSDAQGKFELKNVPVGKDIPLVIQIGKWRRQTTIPEVKACTKNALNDPELTRLPKKQSEGDLPKIALISGGCDKLGCMLPKVGIDPSEFGTEGDGPSKSVHTFLGGAGSGPEGATDAIWFWRDTTKLLHYDLVLLSCECSEMLSNKGPDALAAITEYLHKGGRIFTTDYMYTWYRDTPDTALKSAMSLRGGARGAGSPMSIETSFPKGKALSDWLETVTPGSKGRIRPEQVFSNIQSNDDTKSQLWATSSAPNPGPCVVSVNVPVGVPADQQCGKGVHIDAHLNLGSEDDVNVAYPASCSTVLKEGEKLLSFFFFDLASCIQNEADPPTPPPVN